MQPIGSFLKLCVYLCAGFDRAYPTPMQYKIKLSWRLHQKEKVLGSAHQTLWRDLTRLWESTEKIVTGLRLSAQAWRSVNVKILTSWGRFGMNWLWHRCVMLYRPAFAWLDSLMFELCHLVFSYSMVQCILEKKKSSEVTSVGVFFCHQHLRFKFSTFKSFHDLFWFGAIDTFVAVGVTFFKQWMCHFEMKLQ